MISSSLGVSKQVEVIILVIWGIFINALDTSLFHLKQDLEELWNSELDLKLQKNNIDVYLKYVISATIFIRTLTLHIFLAFYIVMLWPALFADRPNLLIPWLVVGFVRTILVKLITLITGIYVCIFLKGYDQICLDFIMSQIVEHGPSVYVWLTVLNYYQELCWYDKDNKRKTPQDSKILFQIGRSTESIEFPEVQSDENTFEKLTLQNNLSEPDLAAFLTEKNDIDITGKSSRSLDSLSKTSNISQTHSKEKNSNLAERAKLKSNLTDQGVNKGKIAEMKTDLEKNEKLMSSTLLNADVKIEKKKCINSVHPSCAVVIADTANPCKSYYMKNAECLKQEEN